MTMELTPNDAETAVRATAILSHGLDSLSLGTRTIVTARRLSSFRSRSYCRDRPAGGP